VADPARRDEASPGTGPRPAGSDRPATSGKAQPAGGSAPAPAPPRRRGGRLAWVLALLLAVGAGFLAWRTSELQGRNEALRSELRATRAELDAYRAHLDGARDRTRSLRATVEQQLDELDAFLARDPAPGQ